VEANLLKPQFHLQIVSPFSVIQDLSWDRIIVNGHLVIVVAILFCMPPSYPPWSFSCPSSRMIFADMWEDENNWQLIRSNEIAEPRYERK
jgi:hypothetical protein